MTDNERELSQQLFGGQERSMGAMEAIKEGLKEFSHQVTAGAHELASLLFTGQAYIQYQRDGKEDQPSHDQAQDNQAMQQDMHGQHLERGGRSM